MRVLRDVSRGLVAIMIGVAGVETTAVANPPADPLEAVPQTDSTLAVIQTDGEEATLLRVDPVNHKSVAITTVPTGAHIAWSYDGQKILIIASRVTEFTLATGVQRQLPITPGRGTLVDAAWDKKGNIHAYTMQEDVHAAADGLVHFDGKTGNYGGYADVSRDLILLPSGQWKRIRSQLVPSESCRSGVPAAGPSTARESGQGGGAPPKEVLPLLMASTPGESLAQGDTDHVWESLKTTPPVAYVHAYDDGIGCQAVSARVIVVDRGATHPLEVPEKEPWDIQAHIYARGSYVLIKPQDAEQPTNRLFDVKTRRELYNSSSRVYFWPVPNSASGYPQPIEDP